MLNYDIYSLNKCVVIRRYKKGLTQKVDYEGNYIEEYAEIIFYENKCTLTVIKYL